MSGDRCICGSAFWHKECYASFNSIMSNAKLTNENIRLWKMKKEDVTDQDIAETMPDEG